MSATASPPVDNTEDEVKEDEEIEFDENDNKIMQLYEVINELLDEQKARAEDLELLYNGQGELVLQNVENRNDSVLNQLYTEMQLKEKNEEEEEEDDDEDDSDDESEDEQDQGWEIYNSVVANLNNYMQQLALFTTKLKEQRELMELYEGPQEDEIKELESVVEEQTVAIEGQMKRNENLENALSNVLNEYSNRITVGNKEISSLHEQLSKQNKQHSLQLKELRSMYEKKINSMKQTTDNQYKEEVNKLIDTLEHSRIQYAKQFEEITKEMSEQQTNHHKELISLTAALTEKTMLIEELKDRQSVDKKELKKSIRKFRTRLEIDDEDEFTKPKIQQPTTNNTVKSSNKKNRSFTPSKYNSNTMGAQYGNNNNRSPRSSPSSNSNSSSSSNPNRNFKYKVNNGNQRNHQHQQQQQQPQYQQQPQQQQQYQSNGNNHYNSSKQQQSQQSSALQAKYAKYKTSSNKGYKSRSHKTKKYQSAY